MKRDSETEDLEREKNIQATDASCEYEENKATQRSTKEEEEKKI